jgi:hypothetical protein
MGCKREWEEDREYAIEFGQSSFSELKFNGNESQWMEAKEGETTPWQEE